MPGSPMIKLNCFRLLVLVLSGFSIPMLNLYVLNYAATTVCPACSSVSSPRTMISPLSSKGTRPARMFLGILTTQKEGNRRLYIRDTMLSMDDRVCSLPIYMNSSRRTKCQVVYAFILGANSSAPRNKEKAKTLEELVMPSPEQSEPDAVYLNIMENMNDGKVPTFFKYGLLVDPNLDYIAKCDSDTMIHMTQLVDYINNYLPSADSPLYHPTYGGTVMDYKYCGGPRNKHCEDLKGRIYMQGSFYFMSRHLAQHVTSVENVTKHRFEDFDMGMRVATYDKAPINLSILNTRTFYRHFLKSQQEWKKWWVIGTSPNSTLADKTEAFYNGWGAWGPGKGGLG